jgi:PncC family amidohydrolase
MTDDGWEMLLELAKGKGITFSTVESCTGGYIASRITDVPGASESFLGGVVVYSNRLKIDLAGVREKTLSDHGAVSRECAVELASGFRKRSGADATVSVTGIAGPTGGSREKPVGTVYIGISAGEADAFAEGFLLKGLTRIEFKEEVAKRALGMLLGAIDSI